MDSLFILSPSFLVVAIIAEIIPTTTMKKSTVDKIIPTIVAKVYFKNPLISMFYVVLSLEFDVWVKKSIDLLQTNLDLN